MSSLALKKISALVSGFMVRVRGYRKVLLPLRKKEDILRLPVMARADLKAFAAAGFIPSAFNITSTSGSTGSRLLIVHSRAAYNMHLRRLARMYRSIGAGPGEVCLNLCSYELNSGGRMMEAAYKAAGSGVIALGGISTPQKCDEAVSLIRALRPAIVNAYTNQLFDLFSRLGARHSIRKCVVNGEPLWPSYRERIERIGKVRIHDHYGAMEVSGFAITRRPEDPYMSVFSDGLFFEVLRDDGTAADEGVGALLVTDLENTCMPFIRYRLGDRVELCRRRGAIMVKVLSRTEDTVLVNGVVGVKSMMIRTVNDLLGHPDFFFEIKKDSTTYKDTLLVNIPAADMPVGPKLTGLLRLVAGIDP